jgi:predicted esterase
MAVALNLNLLAMVGNTPQRILCLHGKGELGSSFLATFSALREATSSTAEWQAIDAPHPISGGRAWWLLAPGERSFTAISYIGDDVSLAAIDEAWREGSFDGIMGFSQGAMLAAILVARAVLAPENQDIARPRFAILYGSAWPKPWGSMLSRVQAEAAGTTPPSLHILGRADKTNPPEQGEQVAACLGGTVRWHEGGHCVAVDANEAVVEFLRSCAPSGP